MKPEQVQRGDIMAFTYWAKVDDIKKNTLQADLSLQVLNLDDNNSPFGVHGSNLIEKSFSADRYTEEKKVTKTEAAQLLVNAYNRPFTVGFTKVDGSSRTLRGRLLSPEPLLGRSHVEDLDITSGSRLRLVDHRSIEFLIIDGVKYVVK